MINQDYMLTTVDNPYNPFEQFTLWNLFDVEKGYNTCSRLARIAHTSEQFSEKENEEEIERAMDEIIQYDVLDIYKKIARNEKVSIQNNQTVNDPE